MRIILVNPYFNGIVYAPAMGLGFLATYVKKNIKAEVEIYDPIINKLVRHEVLAKVKDADFLGIICFTESRFECFSFAEDAKKVNPDLKIIIGGPHVIGLDKRIIEKYRFVDFIVRNEGEESFLEIITGKDSEDIKGITWKNKGGKAVSNVDRNLTNDFSRYEYDFNLIKDIFLWKDGEVGSSLKNVNHIPIIVSRGCPYRCGFCASFNQWRCVYRTLKPKEIVDIMEKLYKENNVGYFRFYDALFLGSDQKIIEFCNELNNRNLNVKFRVDLRINTGEEALRNLKKAGCDIVGFGIESGSNVILKRMNKGITNEMIVKTLKACKRLGFWTIGYFMVSLPDETKEDMKLTFELFKYVDVYNLQFFKVHPGTPFYDELKAKGMISDEIWFDHNMPSEIFHSKETFKTALYSKKEIEWIMLSTFYKFCIRHPKLIYSRHGFSKGIFYFGSSLIDLPLHGLLHKNIYSKLINRD